MYNSFKVVMRSSDRVLELKKRIIDYHGCVNDIHIFNKDPYPPRTKKDNFRMQKMPRVPPFRELPRLKALMKEQEEDDRRKKREAEKEQDGSDDDKKKSMFKEDPLKYDDIKKFDYPLDSYGENIVEYDHKEISLYEVFQNYGTAVRPKENPKDDPEAPPVVEKPPKEPTPKKKVEPEKVEGEEGEEGKEPEKVEEEAKKEEEPEEEPFIPPVDKVLWYDFKTHNPKDPVLLALMVKGENDLFTL